MHYLGNKHRQDTVGKVLYGVVALELTVAAFFYLYWGIKVGTSDTLVAAEYKGKMVGATVAYFFYLLAVAGLTYGVLRKTHKKSVTISYAILLTIAIVTFFGIAYMGPKVRDETKEEFDRQCKPENITADLKKVDAFYGQANAQLCQVSCPCNANPSDWAGYKSDPLTNIIPVSGKTSTGNVIITSKDGANNYPQCPLADAAIQTFMAANFNNTKYTLQQGLSILSAVESDFECGGYCGKSKFYSFSTVSQGPPPQNCTQGINMVMQKSARITLWSGVTFGIVGVLGLFLTIFYIFQRKGDLEEPLLHH